MAIEYPVKLKLLLDKGNLGDIKKGIEAKLSRQSGGVAGSAAGGGGGAAAEGLKTQKSILKSVGKFAAVIGLVGLIASILGNIEPVTFLIGTLMGLINALLSPIVLLFLTLFKPFLLLFIATGRWMFKFFKDPVGSLKGLFDGLANFFTGKTPAEKSEGVGVGIGQGVGAVVGGILGSALGPVGTVLGALLGGIIGGWIVKFGILLGEGLAFIVLKAYDFGKFLGEKLAAFIIWLGDSLKTVWNWTMDFGGWLWEKIQSIWSWAYDLASWLWETLKTNIWTGWIFDFVTWIWNNLKSVWNWTYDFGGWLWDTITSIFSSSLSVLSGIGSWISSKIRSLLRFSKGSDRSQKAFGGEITREGSYYLHRGEQVIPASKVSGGSKNNITLNINVSGGGSNDPNMIAKKVLSELKRYGVY